MEVFSEFISIIVATFVALLALFGLREFMRQNSRNRILAYGIVAGLALLQSVGELYFGVHSLKYSEGIPSLLVALLMAWKCYSEIRIHNRPLDEKKGLNS